MTNMTISADHIAEAAYHIWMAEGCPTGREDEHWLAAEAQLAKAAPVAKKRAAPKKAAAAKKAAPKDAVAKAPAKPRARKAAPAKTA